MKKTKSVKEKKGVKSKGKVNLGGRPLIEIDIEQLGAFCRLDPSSEDCAAFFKCSVDTIEKVIKRKTGLGFTEFKARNLVYTRYQLIRSAVKKAETDTKMHIFALQNMCKWSRNTKVESDVNQNVTGAIDFSVAKDELEKRIEELKKKK
jgi:hypothetical protein